MNLSYLAFNSYYRFFVSAHPHHSFLSARTKTTCRPVIALKSLCFRVAVKLHCVASIENGL
jgi:hypothetical protein